MSAWRMLPEFGQVRLESPRLRNRCIQTMRSMDCSGTIVQDCGVWGVLPDRNGILRAVLEEQLLMAHLPRPLAPLLVTNDFMGRVTDTVNAPDVAVELPVQDNAFDGKKWRVQAADVEFARAVLTPRMWEVLERIGARRKFLFFVDGPSLIAPVGLMSGARGKDARELGEVAGLLRDHLRSGILDRWIREPDLVPVDCFGKGDCGLRGWGVSFPERGDFDRLVEGTLEGGQFRAYRFKVGRAAVQEQLWPLDHEVPAKGFGGVVTVALDHPVPSRVHYARKPLVDLGNVTTEWLDFNDDFQVRSPDEQVGHEVTTPLLMQYLHDHRVRQMEVRDGQLLAGVARFAADDIEKVARTLMGARRHLPGYGVIPSTRSR